MTSMINLKDFLYSKPLFTLMKHALLKSSVCQRQERQNVELTRYLTKVVKYGTSFPLIYNVN